MTIGPGHDGEVIAVIDGTLHVRGEVDQASCHLFASSVLEHVVNGRVRIDMAACTFCDSSCLNVLADARRRGIIVTVCAPSPPVARVLALTGLDLLLTVEP